MCILLVMPGYLCSGPCVQAAFAWANMITGGIVAPRGRQIVLKRRMLPHSHLAFSHARPALLGRRMDLGETSSVRTR